MPYTNPDTMLEVANILEDFDQESLQDIFKSQIISEDAYTTLPINHFRSLHASYKRAMSIENADEDDIAQIKSRYFSICLSIINNISAKYNIELDDEWLQQEYGKLPAVTMALYQFFVLDIFYLILETLNNYIHKNIDDLFNTFADAVQGKDVSTITNMKIMDPKYGAIASCMYDVTDYAFTMMDTDTIFDYINKDYIPGAIVKSLVSAGDLNGDFVHAFADIYKENLTLRSKICFELIYRIKEKGYLPYNPIVVHGDELVRTDDVSDEETLVRFTDIEDDVDSE